MNVLFRNLCLGFIGRFSKGVSVRLELVRFVLRFISAVPLLYVCLWGNQLHAAIDVHEFDSEYKNDQFQVLVQELRCPKCQNQNLADSNSQISIDLRDQVARLVSEGRSDKEIKAYMVERYGEFVLYRPPVENSTLALWLGPAVMFGIALLVFGFVVRGRASVSDDEDD